MPELPEVETTVRAINKFKNKTLKEIVIHNKNLRWKVEKKVETKTKNKKVIDITRRAKYIILHLTNFNLMIHLGMSGKLRIQNNKNEKISLSDELARECFDDILNKSMNNDRVKAKSLKGDFANLQTEQYFFSLSSNSSINSSTDNTSFQNNNQNNGKDANADSAILKRQEQYQQLSEKLGESVARRIINQIARGTWNIQLALKPASLGTIEINLKLRGNEIEASFHANQAYTRELLTDGLPRLRDVLEKSGINVAHVDINDKKQDKNDGSSTEKDKSNYVVKEKSNESSIEDNKDKPKPKNIISSDGLNVLV